MKTLIQIDDRPAVGKVFESISKSEMAVDTGYETLYVKYGVRPSDWKCPTIKPFGSDVGEKVNNPESSCTVTQWAANKEFTAKLLGKYELQSLDVKLHPEQALELAQAINPDVTDAKGVAALKRGIAQAVSARMDKIALGLTRAAYATGDKKYLTKAIKQAEKADAIKSDPDAGKSGVKGEDLKRLDKGITEAEKVANQMKDALVPVHDLDLVKDVLARLLDVRVPLAALVKAAEKSEESND
jgi:hypothetical protein